MASAFVVIPQNANRIQQIVSCIGLKVLRNSVVYIAAKPSVYINLNERILLVKYILIFSTI